MKYSVAFYCNSIPFTAASIDLRTSLGGSESAMIYIANSLAELGHDVTIFSELSTHCEGNYNGVNWIDKERVVEVCEMLEPDIFISLRFAQIAKLPIRAKYRAVWFEDELYNPNDLKQCLFAVDELIFVSEFQRDQYRKGLDLDFPDFTTVNSIDLEKAKKYRGIDKDPNKLIFTSRPERGLFSLLKIFKQMRKTRPDLNLFVSRYHSMYENNPSVIKTLEKADRLVTEAENVHFLGELNKDELYAEIASSKLLVYPGIYGFNETSCITAIEAQAVGTPMICSDRGGLKETLSDQAGRKIDGDPRNSEYREMFVEACFTFLDNPDLYTKSIKAGFKQSKNYDRRKVAKGWIEHFDRFFADRSNNDPNAIADELIRHDDFLAVRSMGKITDERIELAKKQVDFECSPDTYASHTVSIEQDLKSKRLRSVLEFVDHLSPESILDYACGAGAMSFLFKERFPDASVTAIDFSDELIDRGRKFDRQRNNSDDDQVNFHLDDKLPSGKFDLIFVGEFLEHLTDPYKFLSDINNLLTSDGTAVYTVPSGPFSELDPKNRAPRTHKIHWSRSNIEEMFGEKADFRHGYLSLGRTVKGSLVGHHLIAHGKKGEFGGIDFQKKLLTARPYESISVCMIVHNEEANLAKCLESVSVIADEIIVANLKSTDNTREIAKSYGAKIIDLPRKDPRSPDWCPPPGDFSWARNQSIATAKGKWILWIDADEILVDPMFLKRYTEGAIFNGYAIRQVHLMRDAPVRFDKPIRFFRNFNGYHFFGAIHEHAQKNLNVAISPAMELPRTEIYHFGYVNETQRKEKCRNRNIQLLAYDRQMNPDRQLGKVLLAREYQNMTNWELQDHQCMTDEAKQYCKSIIDIYRSEFQDPKDPYFDQIYNIYSTALLRLDRGVGIDVRIEANSKSELRVESDSDLNNIIKSKTRKLAWQDQL